MRPTPLKKYGSLIILCVFASLFFIGLFHFDNKYQKNTIQAANGTLILSDETCREAPLRYLVNGWLYYPNELLTPEALQSANHYATVTSIGEHTHFLNPFDNTPYGCGTYQMTFDLPKRNDHYAIEIPEVFSAYTLYLNDEKIIQMGDPVTGQALIQNRLVTFEGGEPVTLTLAVSNYHHFYGGMVYPPAFGSMVAVNTARGIRLMGALFGCAITLIFALLSLYLGYRIKQMNAFLFSIICLAMGNLTATPIVHMLFALPVFPWYTLELGNIYLLIWLIIILQNRLCHVSALPAMVSNGLGGIFFCTALGYGTFSSHLTVSAMTTFSTAVCYYKMFFALYLLIISFHALYKEDTLCQKAIFATNLIASISLLFDRLLPNFEPIIGGWFIEWGIFFVVLAIGYSLWRNVIEGYSNSLIFDEERKQVTRQLAMQTEYNRQSSNAVEENRRLIHDIKHHLRTIEQLAANHGQVDICQYLAQIEAQVATAPSVSHPLYCRQPAVNALISCYAGMAQLQEADFQVRLDLSDTLPLSDIEWCTMLGNLLDNAVEACARQKQGERRILVAGAPHGNRYFLKVENTYDGQLIQHHQHLLSHKGPSPYHGIGLSSVQKIVDAYNGDLDIMPGENTFVVGISLPF